jgi:hypothetical protein
VPSPGCRNSSVFALECVKAGNCNLYCIAIFQFV